MSHWYLPVIITGAAAQDAIARQELAIPAQGLPDLTRAQSPDQVTEWLKRFHPDVPPEQLAEMAQHYWRLGHELLAEDTVILPVGPGRGYLIGEVQGVGYLKEEQHVWPVSWQTELVSSQALASLALYAGATGLTEITDEDALQALQVHIPTLRKPFATFFRWLAIVILVSELIYFWPRGQ